MKTVDCDGGTCLSVLRTESCKKQESQCWEGRIGRERRWEIEEGEGCCERVLVRKKEQKKGAKGRRLWAKSC